MAHKLASGDYRHKDHLIRCTSVPCSTGFQYEWTIRSSREFKGVIFDTLKLACEAIDQKIGLAEGGATAAEKPKGRSSGPGM